MDLEIRRLIPADADDLRSIRLRMQLETPAVWGTAYGEELKKPITHYTDRLTAPTDIFVGAFTRDGMVGLAAADRVPGIRVRHRAYVWGIYVDPTARGRGVATRLVIAVLDLLWDDVVVADLSVLSDNAAAKRTYEKLGFHRTGEIPKSHRVEDTYYDEEVMTLDVAAWRDARQERQADGT